jgi:hypothetical protein
MAPSTQLQSYLILPSPSSIQPYTVLPRPNVVDAWLRYNRNDAWTNPLIPGYLFLTDTASDQVLCTIQLSRVLVSTFQLVITEPPLICLKSFSQMTLSKIGTCTISSSTPKHLSPPASILHT